MTGIDEVILCDNKAKNAGIDIDTVRLFNEASVQKNESKRLDYFFTIHKDIHLIFTLQKSIYEIC